MGGKVEGNSNQLGQTEALRWAVAFSLSPPKMSHEK